MPHLEGVIEIGTTATKLLVAEVRDDATWEVVDSAELPASLGQDVFTGGLISRENLMQCLANLKRFQEQLRGWGLAAGENVTVIATSALREAANRDAVVDRIFVKTGFAVTPIDGVEENRLMYLALIESLRGADPGILDVPSLIIEVGGGSTEILITEKKKIQAAHSFRLGTIMIGEWVKSLGGAIGDVTSLVDEYVGHSKPWLNSEINLHKIPQFFALGQDARLAAEFAGVPVAPKLRRITRERFDAFTASMQGQSTEECAARFKVSRLEAQYLHIGLLEYQRFLHLTGAETVLVPASNIREGVVISKIAAPNAGIHEQFTVQIIASAHLSDADSLWLKSYDKGLSVERLDKVVQTVLEQGTTTGLARYIQVLMDANFEQMMEVKTMKEGSVIDRYCKETGYVPACILQAQEQERQQYQQQYQQYQQQYQQYQHREQILMDQIRKLGGTPAVA
jgi:exopolyphosphatase/guanosine-5'-triphosphate,3'-diphosphate pyrophosphatase